MQQSQEQPTRSKRHCFSFSSRHSRDVHDKANTASKKPESPVQLHSQPSPALEKQVNGAGARPNGDKVVSHLGMVVTNGDKVISRQASHVRTESPLEARSEVGEAASGQRHEPRHSNDEDNGLGVSKEDHENDENAPPGVDEELDESESEPRRDLWAEAWESDDIGDERRTLLKGKWEDKEIEKLRKAPKDLVNSVVELTQDKLATYTKRWGTENKKTASSKARSILLSALTVKDLIDATLKFDPTGYGSAAWAVVSFGLKLVQNDKENTDLTFESCEFLSDLMARYTRIEVLYWERKVKDAAPLEAAMIKIYIAILRYSAEVKESAQSSIIHRTKKSIMALTGKPLKTLKDGIVDGDKTVEDWQKQIDREEQHKAAQKLEGLREKANGIADGLEKTATGIAAVKEIVLDEESGGLFKWLFNEESAGQRKTHKELRDAIEKSEGGDYKAGRWLFENDEYLEWKKYPQSLLWLFANSGSGKSSLCSTIIQNLEDSFEKDDTKVLMYWYFRFYIDETKRIDLLVRSLLRQLGSKCKRFPDDILNWLRSYRDSGKSMKTDKLFENLSTFISKVNKDVFIVLDGLDEFPEDSKEAKRSQLLDHITKLAQAGHPNLHIILVSKDMRDIRRELEDNLKDILVPVDIKKELNKDLDNFIKRKMEGIKILTDHLKQDINEKLEKGDDRNFLYATSLLNEVADCQNTTAIRNAINSVPSSMVAIYEEALKNVKKEREREMKSILIWLMRQLRPLTQDEIAAAVGLAEAGLVTQICTKALMEPWSQNVTVAGQVKALEVLRFTHSSAKDYLEEVLLGSPEPQKPEIARFVFSNEDVNLQMTRRCLEILTACGLDHTAEDDAESDTKKIGLPLLQYAAEYWFEHYKLIDRKKISKVDLEALDRDVCSYLRPDSSTLALWLKTYDPDRSQTPLDAADKNTRKKDEGGKATFPSPVYYAVKLVLLDIAQKLIAQIEDVQMLDRSGSEGTTLQLVAHRGHSTILDALLERRVNVNALAGVHGTALYAASARGDETLVKKLLAAGATPDGAEDGALGNPLHVAAFCGHIGVIRVLLETGHLQVDHSAGPFGTALQAASASKKLSAVKLLLDYQAKPNTIGGCLKTAIQAALSGAEEYEREEAGIIKTLRSAGARYREDYDFWTAAYDRAYFDHRMSDYNSLIKGERSISKELEEPQRLLAGAIRTWTLPGIFNLKKASEYLAEVTRCKIPLQFQMEAILRAAPRLETNIEELSRKDFRHRALFWAGINHIFKGLVPLLRNYSEIILHDFPYSSRYSEDSPLSAFKWLYVDLDGARYGYHDGLLRSWRTVRRRGRADYDYPGFVRGMTAMDQSDLIATDLIKYTQRLGLDTEVIVEPEGKFDLREVTIWLLSDLLSLVRDLVQYGDRCSRYHDEAIEKKDSISKQTVKIIKDLTFELFSAVIRLSTCMGEDEYWQRSIGQLSRTVKLLRTIRLERIRELDATCEKLLAQMLLAGLKDYESRYQEMTTEAMKRVQKTVVDQVTGLQAGIASQLGEWQPSLIREIESVVSVAVKAEVSQALEKVQDELRSKIQHEVRRQLLGTTASSGWLSFLERFSPTN